MNNRPKCWKTVNIPNVIYKFNMIAIKIYVHIMHTLLCA